MVKTLCKSFSMPVQVKNGNQLEATKKPTPVIKCDFL